MSAALLNPMSVAGVLAREERHELRWEFDGFQPVAMTGGTVGHEVLSESTSRTDRGLRV